jgi:regulator of sigma E protease
MTSLPGVFGTLFDLALVILGFGLIVFVHELGHFLAARWAGIRVLAFAMGFGPAVASYRRGLGWRRGSSEPEYLELARRQRAGERGVVQGPAGPVEPTEYRLNALPFGGYVKMLGQEDLNPDATSDAPDSYQRTAPVKRMVVISAGVIMNMITAAILFVVVFMVGLRTEPPKIGDVAPGRPASKAIAANAAALGVQEVGLQPGDEIVSINGATPRSFNDLMLAVAMARQGTDIHLRVQREGIASPLDFTIRPERNRTTALMEIGVEPARSAKVYDGMGPEDAARFSQLLADRGIKGIEPGMTLVEAGGKPARAGADLARAARQSGGQPFELMFRKGDKTLRTTLAPKAEMQTDLTGSGATQQVVEHLLGLTPVLTVEKEGENGSQGLLAGDIFARLGSSEFPSMARGVAEIRSRKGQTIDAVVLRKNAAGAVEQVPLTLKVSRQGQVGFYMGDTSRESTLLALPPETITRIQDGAKPRVPAAAGVISRPGARILAVDGTSVGTFTELRAALMKATAQAHRSQTGATVKLNLELPLRAAEKPPTQAVEWVLAASDVADLHALGWSTPIPAGGIFEPEEFVLKASGPVDALKTGLHETHRVMMTTYLTFARLFDGTVKVEHLKGPVGIAHLGTVVASRGFIWLLFFMALISVNLAVLNFLPMPIVDGGQFVFLLVEQMMGKPVPVRVQNVATLAGLALIGSMFLIVTFNDIMNLVRP